MPIKDENTKARQPGRGKSRRSWAHSLLFGLPAETAHSIAMRALRLAQTRPFLHLLERRYRFGDAPILGQADLLGLTFPNPIGLAAGFDKNGEVIAGMAALGFGWLEVGAVTPRPQKGNPRPRLFRYPSAGALENAMGFNNHGSRAMERRLGSAHPAAVPLFVNLGKNRDTANENALDDYLELVERLRDRCDGFVLNVSSPNTPGLRDLQRQGAIRELVDGARSATRLPLLVKLSPDLEIAAARDVASESVAAGADGIVLANTTTDYALLPGARKIGGLSGRVLRERSMALLEGLADDLFGRSVLVSVGGVASAEDVYARLRAGASLVQLYSALVFEGPGLVARMKTGLQALLARDGCRTVGEVIGADR